MSDLRKKPIHDQERDEVIQRVNEYTASYNEGVTRDRMFQFMGEPSDAAKDIISTFESGSGDIYLEFKDAMILRRTGSEIYWYPAIHKGMLGAVAYYKDRPIYLVEYNNV